MPTLAKYFVYYPIQWLRREPVFDCFRKVQETQWYSPDELIYWQGKRLQKTVLDAMRFVPYYQRVFREACLTPESFKVAEDLKRLPLLTKSALREHARSLISRDYKGLLSSKTTGGSTGEAVTVVKDRTATAYARGVMWRNYGWWGIDIGDRQGRFWGIPITSSQKFRYKIIDLLSNRIRLSSFNFSDGDFLAYYGRLNRFRPQYLYGYASMIYEFADFLQRNNIKFSVPLVITTSEVLYSYQRDLIQKILSCRVINEYGCGEVGPIAFECPEGGMHLMADNLYIEILKEDGSPASCGEVGQVVVTELHSRAMPLIRYQIMDSVEVGDERCPCGRSLPLIREVIGRAYDYLVSKSGRRFHGEKVMYLLEHLQDLKMGVRYIQVTQKTFLKLNIKVVQDEGFKDKALDIMRAYFSEALGQSLDIEFQSVNQIPRERSGKLRVVICEL